MTSLTANEAMVVILSQAEGLAEIRDPGGKVIGFYAPVSRKDAASSVRALAQIDRAELERRKQSKEKGYTTAEVFEHLLTLTQDEPTRAHLRQKIAELRERHRCDTP